MIKSLKKEISLIGNNKRIAEKLMVIAIYNEFYNDVIDTINPKYTEEYTTIIEKAFDATVRYFNTNKTRNVSIERFMKVYFDIIRKNDLFNKQPLDQVITNIESQLGDYKNIMNFVSVIDGFDELFLERKVDIMVQYREYANELLNSINDMFGYKTIKGYELRFSILHTLKTRLEHYLSYCKKNNISPGKISSNLRVNMIKPIKNLLLDKLDDCTLGVRHVQDDSLYEFLDGFNDLEQDIWMMEFIYEITGCNKNAKALNFNKSREICNFLGISKIKYALTNVSMGLRTLNTYHKINDSSVRR